MSTAIRVVKSISTDRLVHFVDEVSDIELDRITAILARLLSI